MKHFASPLLIGVIALGIVACKDTAPSKTPAKTPVKTPAKTPVKAPTEAAKKTPEATPKPPAKAIPDAKIKAMVNAWVKAQNDGDFKQYDVLYAKRMTGIKRIGTRTYRFNRAGWVKDRKRMFKKKMNVSADKISIHPTSQSAVVSFIQTWESGKYKDVGPKQLLVVKEGDSLRIAREEMLNSDVKKVDAADRLPLETFAFVQRYNKTKFGIVLEHKSAIPAKGKVEGANPHDIVSRGVDMGKLPKAHKTLLGKSFALYGRKGKVCQGTIDGFRLTKDVTLHFSMGQTWEEDKTPMQRRLNTTWDYSGGEDTKPTLIATMKTSGDCTLAQFARGADKPAPVYFPSQPNAMGAPLKKVVATTFPTTAQFKAVAKDYKSVGDSPKWWDGSLKDLKVFTNPKDKNKALVHLDMHTTCDNPEVHIWQVWEATKKGDDITLASVSAPKVSVYLPQDVFAVDLDGDNVPELLSYSVLYKRAGTQYQRVEEKVSYYFDCPC